MVVITPASDNVMVVTLPGARVFGLGSEGGAVVNVPVLEPEFPPTTVDDVVDVVGSARLFVELLELELELELVVVLPSLRAAGEELEIVELEVEVEVDVDVDVGVVRVLLGEGGVELAVVLSS